MTSSLRGCPGNGKYSPRRDADARRHRRRRRRKNQFRPWLGDRSAFARRCCDTAAPLSLARRREPRFSGGAELPTATTALPPNHTSSELRPSFGSRERSIHRVGAPIVLLVTVSRAQKHITRATHTIHICVTHTYTTQSRIRTERRRIHTATRAYALFARVKRVTSRSGRSSGGKVRTRKWYSRSVKYQRERKRERKRVKEKK